MDELFVSTVRIHRVPLSVLIEQYAESIGGAFNSSI